MTRNRLSRWRGGTRHVLALVVATLVPMTGGPIRAASGQGGEQSPFAPAEVIPARRAQCHEIKDLVRDVPTPDGLDRIDFAATGPLSLVHFDGALAYLGICSEPDAKVLCVTYSTNDMKVGEIVSMAGSYRKMAPNYIVLDPCLAFRPEPNDN